MTSKRLFFKVMREDLRHRIWMIALSCLASFLLLPVMWLMFWSNTKDYIDQYALGEIIDFSVDYLGIVGAFITIAGAMIVGLFGARFVFRKNMIDTYHSIPVKRRTLFGACYLNGFLIWFVPFTLSMLITVIMAGGVVRQNFGSAALLRLLQIVGWTYLTLIVVFLLVYNLVLTAVMLSGNILNTLVSMMVLGVGVISIFALCILYCSMYLSTFYSVYIPVDWAVYTSPLVSAIWLVVERLGIENTGSSVVGYTDLGISLLVNMGVIILLWFAALKLYEKRASELAEQGVKNKVLNPLMRFAVSLVAGLGGWLIFTAATDYAYADSSLGWGVFGGVLFGILAFGVMDIIFSMDFKAFFAHKLQMAITVAVILVISFAFYGDWMGFDHYLPDREDVAELAIYGASYNNRVFYLGNIALSSIHIQDTDAVYAFLERMADKGIGLVGTRLNAKESQKAAEDDGESVAVRITLQNGRSYYRYYYMQPEDKDVVWPLLTSYEYIEKSYLIPEEPVYCDSFTFGRNGSRLSVEMSLEDVKAVIRAYNRDVMENPDVVLVNQGRLLVNVILDLGIDLEQNGDISGKSYFLDIYDTMENTIEALTQAGYGEMAVDIRAEDIEDITLQVRGNFHRFGDSPQTDGSVKEAMNKIRVYFGLERIGDEIPSEEAIETFSGRFEIAFTDREEIQELAPLFSYTTAYSNSGIFQQGFYTVTVTDKEGNSYRCYLRPGIFPEKYINKFESQVEALFLQQEE